MFLLTKYILNNNIITQAPEWLASESSKKLIKHSYILGIVVTLIGFGIQHQELDKAQQALAKSLINTETKSNLATIQLISKNSQTILNSHQNL